MKIEKTKLNKDKNKSRNKKSQWDCAGAWVTFG